MKAASSVPNSQPIFVDGAHALDFHLVNNKIARVGAGAGIAQSRAIPRFRFTTESELPCRRFQQPDGGESVPVRVLPMLSGVKGWSVADAVREVEFIPPKLCDLLL